MPNSLEETIKGTTRENLLEQIPAEKIARPKGFYKSIGLDILTVLSAFYFSYACRDFLETGAVIQMALAAFPILVLTSFEVLLTKSLTRRILILALEAAALLSFFYSEKLLFVATAAGAFIAFSIVGETASRAEITNSLEVKFLKFTLPALRNTATALSILIIIFYAPQLDKKQIFISKQAFGSIFVWSTGFIHNFYPEIKFDSSVDELAREVTKYQLQGTHPYEDLPVAAQKILVDQILEQTGVQLKKFLGGNLTGNETLSDVFYNLVVRSLDNWRDQFGAWFTAAWMAVLFLIARSFATIILWVSSGISFLIYHLLVALNFIAIRGETTTKEGIVFP